MDARVMHQVMDTCVALAVLMAQVLHQQQQQFTSQRLVAMDPRCVSELRLTCKSQSQIGDGDGGLGMGD